MHFLGLEGLPRRYSSPGETQFASPLLHLDTFVSVAALITTAAQPLFLVNFFWSMLKGAPAGANPGRATTLEWDSPPPNPPVVYRGRMNTAFPERPAIS
jgi:cytochrome c oxidase subunit I